MSGDVASLAANLARGGCHVFPCREDKRPATRNGFKDATNDPEAIAALWRCYPGPLIGIATGAASGFDCLDLDLKHDMARDWWQAHHTRLPPTRTFRTRSGGLHLLFIHFAGLGCSAGRIAAGIDCRGDGGYIISWYAAGFDCLDHSPARQWPAWLVAELLPKPAPPPAPLHQRGRSIDGVLRAVAGAAEGARNAVLHWSACRLGEQVRAGQLGVSEAESLLVAAAAAAGLDEREARTTARSGLGRTR